jgi:peptide/nickel transport system permease protein
MFVYVTRRLLLMIPTLLLITAVVFAVLKAAPGNPFSAAQTAGEGSKQRMNPEDYQALLVRYGLDRPWYVQYGRWLKSVLTGSFGDSFSQKRPVAQVFFGESLGAFGEAGFGPRGVGLFAARLWESPFGATLFLNLLSLLLMAAVALPAGFRSAVKRGGWFDRLSGGVFYALYALPNFWVAVLLILLFGVHWKLLPFIGMRSDGFDAMGPWQQASDSLLHAVLPAVCLAYGGLAFVARFSRGALLEVLQQDYIRTARAKGLPEGVVLRRHAMRNALVPLLTLAGLLVPALVSGSVIIESIFSWPGLGQVYVKAIYARDYPVIMAESVLGALVVLGSNLLTDVAYAFADPRVRLE